MQWFPGHMAKSIKMLEKIKSEIDFVIQIVDARAPVSTSNPFLMDKFSDKFILTILSKASLTDLERAEKSLTYFQGNNKDALFFDANLGFNKGLLHKKIKEITFIFSKSSKYKGLKNPPIKALVVGIPNVGKSTFINFLKQKQVLKVENKPGITREIVWVKSSLGFYFYDSPGILLPKFTDEKSAIRCALCRNIKEELVEKELVANWLIDYLKVFYPYALKTRYQSEFSTNLELLKALAKKNGLFKNDVFDFERVYELIINDFRKKRFGEVFLENV